MFKKIAEMIRRFGAYVNRSLNESMKVDESWEYTAPIAPQY